MFGTEKYKKGKSKTFTSDNERKRFFAIRNYYSKKSLNLNNEKNNKKN